LTAEADDNDELMRRAGIEMEYLLNIVAMQCVPREEDVQGRPGHKHSRKIYRRCESAGVVFTESLLI